MNPKSNSCLAQWDFGDRRLTKRAVFIGEALFLKYGQPLSQVFKNASELKRTYEFLTNPKTSFQIQKIPTFSSHRRLGDAISSQIRGLFGTSKK